MQLTRALTRSLKARMPPARFKHGAKIFAESLRGRIAILASYHPSPRNTRTGLLTHEMLVEVFMEAVSLAEALQG